MTGKIKSNDELARVGQKLEAVEAKLGFLNLLQPNALAHESQVESLFVTAPATSEALASAPAAAPGNANNKRIVPPELRVESSTE